MAIYFHRDGNRVLVSPGALGKDRRGHLELYTGSSPGVMEE
jgi:hypothetical protein